ncbi:MAG: efflux RND transporter periplasmic adaptor subunit [Nevskiaceae bacterium]|jgi:membrane fusion protein (multidrug efflux system)|nr:efflux RND transporter periplasmic adaptor subunit [Nevskiaceae bacterium]
MGWAVYATKHQVEPGAAPAGAGGQGGGRPGGGGGANFANAQAVAVVGATARMHVMTVGIEAIGTAVANESVDVTSKASNLVTAIHFTDGQAVRAGQVLVELDSAQVSADLAAAQADFTESASQYNRSRDLVAENLVSQSQFDQLRGTMESNQARVAAAQSRLNDTVIRAPFSGRVGLRRVSVGSLISPGTVITTLDDSSTIKVDFALPDLYVGAVHNAQAIIARTNAFPGRDFRGSVSSVDSRVDPLTRSVTVRALVPNADSALKPGMFLTVQLSQESREALVVPEEALVPEQARQFVYLIEGEAVTKREVRLGRREPGLVEIVEGLRAGDRVVIEGTLKLRDGAKILEQPAEGADSSHAPASSEVS